MRHLLIGILISYRNYRKTLGYHGQVTQTSIVGVENTGTKLYRNNYRGDFYDEFGKLKNKVNGKKSGQDHLDLDLYDFQYRLIYHHRNMLTIKEWLNMKTSALKLKAR
jgi:hypothetical protein